MSKTSFKKELLQNKVENTVNVKNMEKEKNIK